MPPEEIDSLADDVKPLVLKLLRQISGLTARVDELLAQNKALLARIAEIEAERGKPPKTPNNSSLPPSRGQKGNVAEPTRVKKARKGHPGAARALAENPDATRDIYTERWACGAALAEAGQELARAWAHVDLPPIKPITTRFCLAHLIRDAQYAIDHGDTIFAPQFKAFLKDACAVGRRRPDLADSTIGTHRRRLDRELDRLLDLKPTDVEGSHLRAAIVVTARDKLLVFLTRRDVEATNNASERALRPSVIFRRVTNGFRSEWGAKVYADLCSIVATGRLAGRSALAAIRDALATPAPERAAA